MLNTPKPITNAEIKEMLTQWETPVFFTGPYSKLKPQTQVAVLGVFSTMLAQAVYFAAIDRTDEVQLRMERVKLAAKLNSSPHLNTLLLIAQISIEAMGTTPSTPLYEVRKEEIGKPVIRKEPTT